MVKRLDVMASVMAKADAASEESIILFGSERMVEKREQIDVLHKCECVEWSNFYCGL